MKKNYQYLPIAAAFVILAGIAVSFLTIDSMTQKSAEMRAEAVLFDSAQAQAAAFGAVIDGQYRMLSILSEHVSAHCQTDTEAIKQMLAEMFAGSGFSQIRYIDAAGNMYTEDETVNVSGREYFKAAISGRSSIQLLTVEKLGMQAVALCVPYVCGSNIAGAICGWLDEQDIRELLASEAYGGAGYSMMLNSEGDVIVSADSEYRLSVDGSVSFMENAVFDNGMTFNDISSKLKNGESFMFSFSYNGDKRIAAIAKLNDTRIPDNDWFIISAVSDEFLAGETEAERDVFFRIIYIMTCFGVIAIVLVVLYQRESRRRERLNAEDVRQREECFRIVAEQTGRFVFRYDIPTHTYYQVTESEKRFGVPKIMPDFVNDVIRRGLAGEESVSAFRGMFELIDMGETPDETDIKLKMQNGEQHWFRFHASLIKNSDGDPQSAVVSYAECGDQRERELAYSRWEQEIATISRENMVLLEWNLTKDIFENELGGQKKPETLETAKQFNENTEHYAKNYVYSEDKFAYLSLMNRERLIGMYHSGRFSATLDFRENRPNGAYHWMSISVQMVMYPASSDVKAYFTVRDIDEEKRAELAMAEKSQLDSLTGVYNRGAFVERVEELLKNAHGESNMLIMLDVDEFKSINDTFGHDAGDRLLQSIAQAARSKLRAEDMIGRVGGDEFMICLTNTASEAAMSGRVEDILNAMRLTAGGERTVTVSMGVSEFPKDGVDFEELYKKADIALYRTKNSGKNSFCFYNKNMEHKERKLTTIDK